MSSIVDELNAATDLLNKVLKVENYLHTGSHKTKRLEIDEGQTLDLFGADELQHLKDFVNTIRNKRRTRARELAERFTKEV